jgi:ribA/ribD-fused uncharacterized protein
MNNTYHFFWNGPFSQWYASKFTSSDNIIGQYNYSTITFNCAEQYMMFKKASLFEDHNTATLILQANDPKTQKALGRKVIGFNAAEWDEHARAIVYHGNFLKFTQNPARLQDLLDTGDKILVEASPYDKIWGIGMGADEAAITPPEQWNGTNWLGEVLTKLKHNLKNNITTNPYL